MKVVKRVVGRWHENSGAMRNWKIDIKVLPFSYRIPFHSTHEKNINVVTYKDTLIQNLTLKALKILRSRRQYIHVCVSCINYAYSGEAIFVQVSNNYVAILLDFFLNLSLEPSKKSVRALHSK